MIAPMLSYEDPGSAADWLVDAFGFTELDRFTDSSGRATHVNLEYGGNMVMAGWPGPGYESPRRHAESCESMRKTLDTPFVVDGVFITVEDIDAHYARAKAAGARILTDVENNPGVGQRQYRVEDPEGHRWMFAEPD